jgi:type IV secretion system protein VirB1
MDATTFATLALACAPLVHASTAHALVAVESGFNPHAIGVVGGSLIRQPMSLPEALATAKQLQADGWNFSVGLAQINVSNFARMGLTTQSAFEPCANLAAMQTVLAECFERSNAKASEQTALQQALSCY